MALEGNLRDFSLADMFRLLSSGSKTGTLLIDEIGKDVSGAGLDTNVVGRKFNDHQAAPDEQRECRPRETPRFTTGGGRKSGARGPAHAEEHREHVRDQDVERDGILEARHGWLGRRQQPSGQMRTGPGAVRPPAAAAARPGRSSAAAAAGRRPGRPQRRTLALPTIPAQAGSSRGR